MKKIVSVLLILLTCLSAFAATRTSAPVQQYLLGHVKSAVYMTVIINEDVLPFNIDSRVVKSQETGTGEAPLAVNGLRIGYYSLVTNNYDFSVTVTHDKLVLFRGTAQPDELTELDYRLYLFTEDKSFESCLSTGSIVITHDDFPSAGTNATNFMLAKANASLYLSLAVSDTSDYAAGDYESYITIHVEGNQ